MKTNTILILSIFIISCISYDVTDNNKQFTTNDRIAIAALNQFGKTLTYNPEYVKIDYPMGDIEISKGVCTDVVVRAFRDIGIDLQKEIYEDMKKNFNKYQHIHNEIAADSNIDHRRVHHIATWLKRNGKEIPIDSEYLPGDIVEWELNSGMLHIGIVSRRYIESKKRYLIIHNIGYGVTLVDVLNDYKKIGHFRWEK